MLGRTRTRTSLEAVVVHADGTREELGCIAYTDSNLIEQLRWNLGTWLRKRGLVRQVGPRPCPIKERP